MHLPAAIGNFTDFFAGIHHATNGGRRRDPNNPLSPNYKYVPVAYHSRASSVRPSGVPVRRPNGQRKLPEENAPSYGPCRKLDYELELAIWVGPGNPQGETIPVGKAGEHVVGLGLVNDWSARDIQQWEFGGNPVSCAAACAVVDTVDDELLAHVRDVSAQLRAGLGPLGAVRGLGLLIGIELDRPAGPVVDAALALGLVVGTAGERTLRLAPPLTISAEEAAHAIDLLTEAAHRDDQVRTSGDDPPPGAAAAAVDTERARRCTARRGNRCRPGHGVA